MARGYRLGKRAAGVAATRSRIVAAAAGLYREQGIASTTMQEVARRATVSPATVLNHFPTPRKLTDAVVAHHLETLQVPDTALFDGASTREERIGRLAIALAEFYERSEPLYQMHVKERDVVPALRAGERRFHASIRRLVEAALGPLAGRPDTLDAAFVLLGPAALGQLRAQGRSAHEAGRLCASILSSWLRTQPAAPPGRGRKGR